MRLSTRHLVVSFAAVAAVMWIAAPALAHIDPDPTEAPAGSEQSVGFTVEHGCSGSPTTQVDMRLPEGVSNATPEPPDGWTGSVDGNVVTFVGGPLPDETEGTFRVRMTLPTTAGATIYFPFVQRCEQGEIRWIEIPSDGSSSELDEPAPAMTLTEPVATTAAPTATNAPTTTTAGTTTAAVATTTTSMTPTTAPASSVVATTTTSSHPISTTDPPTDTTVADNGVNDDGVGTIVFVGTIAAVAAVAGLVAWQIRRQRS